MGQCADAGDEVDADISALVKTHPADVELGVGDEDRVAVLAHLLGSHPVLI